MSSVGVGILGERRSANWQPSNWDSNRIQSLRSDYNDLQYKRHKELLQVVQQMLVTVTEPLERLSLIDDVQRLGVAYHFQQHIDDALSSLHSNNTELLSKNDLHAISLYFRLLRQHGRSVSPGVSLKNADIFLKFKDEAGEFKASLCEDADGLLSLYEASYLGMKGESILDEARIFAASNLKKLMSQAKADITERISNALDLPLHWKPGRIEARHYIDVYEKNKQGGNDDLLEFAKFDFNMVQVIHQRDVEDLFIWWDSIDLSKKLKFARNSLMEGFLNAVELVPEPQLSECRKAATKDIIFITIIDDIYDIYGSLDELELFTNAIDRWDLEAVDQLPEYMKLCYLALFNTMNEYAYITMKDTGCNVVNYLRKLWARHCKSYLVEAQWFHKKYTPTLEEYLENGWVSVGCPLVLAHVYILMLQKTTKEDVDHIGKYQKLMSLMSLIYRLCDDLGTSKAEMERGDVPTAIQCHMHEASVSEEIGREHIKHLIIDAWKELNEAYLKASSLQRSFVNAIINSARAGSFTYNHGDSFGEPGHKAKLQATTLLFEPIPLNGPKK